MAVKHQLYCNYFGESHFVSLLHKHNPRSIIVVVIEFSPFPYLIGWELEGIRWHVSFKAVAFSGSSVGLAASLCSSAGVSADLLGTTG